MTDEPSAAGRPQIPESMRAAVLFGPGDIRVVDRPVPRPAPDEVLVRVAMCGMCGTDLKIFGGHFPQTPPFGDYTPGHEWTGTVAATGSHVDEFAPGDRVCIEAHRGCGRCDNCLIGKYTACLNYGDRAKGHRATGMTADGGFAEYAVHHVGSLYRLPPSLSFEDAVLISTAGTGLYGIDVAGGYVAGLDVAVFGPGPVGLDHGAGAQGARREPGHPRRHPPVPARTRPQARRRPRGERPRDRPGAGSARAHRRRRRGHDDRVLRRPRRAAAVCAGHQARRQDRDRRVLP